MRSEHSNCHPELFSGLALLGFTLFVRFWTVRVSFDDSMTNMFLVRVLPGTSNRVKALPSGFPNGVFVLYSDEFEFPGLDIYDWFTSEWWLLFIAGSLLLVRYGRKQMRLTGRSPGARKVC